VLNYDDKASRDEVSGEHVAWGKRVREELGPADPPQPTDLDKTRKLKIGYISPDFYRYMMMTHPIKALQELATLLSVTNQVLTHPIKVIVSQWATTNTDTGVDVMMSRYRYFLIEIPTVGTRVGAVCLLPCSVFVAVQCVCCCAVCLLLCSVFVAVQCVCCRAVCLLPCSVFVAVQCVAVSRPQSA